MIRAVILLLLVGTALADDTSVTSDVWQEAIVSVTDLDRSARFFVEIGGYETKWRGPMDASEIRGWGLPAAAGGEVLLLGPPGQDTGLVRLVRSALLRHPQLSATIQQHSITETGCFSIEDSNA